MSYHLQLNFSTRFDHWLPVGHGGRQGRLPCTGVMPYMLHCQITRSTRFVRHVEIIKPNPNPTTNHNPNLRPNLNHIQRNKY